MDRPGSRRPRSTSAASRIPVNVLVIDPISNVASRSGGPPRQQARIPIGRPRDAVRRHEADRHADGPLLARPVDDLPAYDPFESGHAAVGPVRRRRPSASRSPAATGPGRSVRAPARRRPSTASGAARSPTAQGESPRPADTRRRLRMPRTSTRRPSAHHRTKAATGLKASHEPICRIVVGGPGPCKSEAGGDRQPRRARFGEVDLPPARGLRAPDPIRSASNTIRACTIRA